MNELPHEIKFNAYKMGQDSWTCSISYELKGALPINNEYMFMHIYSIFKAYFCFNYIDFIDFILDF